MNRIEEDKVKNKALTILGFDKEEKNVQQGVGQDTTFKRLGISGPGSSKKPDGWYLPNNKNKAAIIFEAKNSDEDIDAKPWVDELSRNCSIVTGAGWKKVIGILHNGVDTRVYLNNELVPDAPKDLRDKYFYIQIAQPPVVNKQEIYAATARINDCLHVDFGIKNLYHRMIFTSCALLSQKYGVQLEGLKDRGYQVLQTAVNNKLKEIIPQTIENNQKFNLVYDVFNEIKMNTIENQKAINTFIDNVCLIDELNTESDPLGQDVMTIFFNEFNRYKKKSESGQVFTPEHVISLMMSLSGLTKNDYIADFTCGSGAMLINGMQRMLKDFGSYDEEEAKKIRREQLFGIEFDREVYALACVNALMHGDGETNLVHMDTRSEEACAWIKSKDKVTKVFMNPPYETKYGCMEIVKNTLDNVPVGTEGYFILPDKKLEKDSKKRRSDILKHHRLELVVKLPEATFSEGTSVSIFMFRAHVPQNGEQFFTYYLEDDGLVTVKNKGRHDVNNKWAAIEAKVVSDIKRHMNGEWESPDKCLSYQVPPKPFEISEEDFKKTAFAYICFKKGIDAKEFGEKLLDATLYGSDVSSEKGKINIKIGSKTEEMNNETQNYNSII